MHPSHPIESYTHHNHHHYLGNEQSKSESESHKSTTSFSSTMTATASTTTTTTTSASLLETSAAQEQPSVHHNHHWSDYKSSGHVASSGRTSTAHHPSTHNKSLTMRHSSTSKGHQKSKSISLPLPSPGHKPGSFLYAKTTGSSISSPTFPSKASGSIPNLAQRRRRANLLRVRIERGLMVGMGLLAGYRMMTLDYSAIKGVLSSQRSGGYRRQSLDAMPILAKSAWSLGAGKYDNCLPLSLSRLHNSTPYCIHFIPKEFLFPFIFPAIPAII